MPRRIFSGKGTPRKRTNTNPIDYVMKERGTENRIPNKEISDYLHGKYGFEGFTEFCYICEEPVFPRWCVVRDGMQICSDCIEKRTSINLKKNEYRRLGLMGEKEDEKHP